MACGAEWTQICMILYKDVLIGCQAGFRNQEKVFMRGFSTPSLRDCSRLDIIGRQLR